MSWRLPKADGSGYAHRPFAYSTRATSALIELLAEDGLTWAQMVAAILYDPDATAIAEAFVAAGHGDTLAAKHVHITG